MRDYSEIVEGKKKLLIITYEKHAFYNQSLKYNLSIVFEPNDGFNKGKGLFWTCIGHQMRH
jgi:hypothetical protein